ncbi:MAG: DNA repair protein RecN [Deltaproteobacteria bacterium]|nr:DNA repair protein RecN [Deltaproteobacteria bacterium]
MIDLIRIRSMAIFDEAEIEFGPGLNCITGETGAGKSLIIGALTLLMGAKASKDLVRPGSDKAVIEAILSRHDREFLLRRDIQASGRSRCFINGELATLEQLGRLSSGIINIYGQHQYQDLLNPQQQMSMLEEMAGIDRSEVLSSYEEFVSATKKLYELSDRIEKTRQDKEDLEYRVAELRQASVNEGEEKEILGELDVSRAARSLKEKALMALDILYSGSHSVIDLSGQVSDIVEEISSMDNALRSVADRLKSLMAEMEDLAYNLRQRSEAYEFDPSRIGELEDRLQLIRDLKRKYNTDEAGLKDILSDLEFRLSSLEESGWLLEDAMQKKRDALEVYHAKLKDLLSRRSEYAKELSELVNADLESLGMRGARFSISQIGIEELEDLVREPDMETLTPSRILRGRFMVSTNIGQPMLDLSRTASGGELSRIMLALKIHQRSLSGGTMVFDEVDSGMGGETAFQLSKRLKEISEHAQTIVVTHLHQVAARADNHYLVTKAVTGNTTLAGIMMLDERQRVMEIARMMGGSNPSPKVIEHARELLAGA